MRDGFNPGHRIPRINDASVPLSQLFPVNHLVGGGDDAGIKAGDAWLVPGDGLGACPVGMLAGVLNHRDVGVIVSNIDTVFSH